MPHKNKISHDIAPAMLLAMRLVFVMIFIPVQPAATTWSFCLEGLTVRAARVWEPPCELVWVEPGHVRFFYI